MPLYRKQKPKVFKEEGEIVGNNNAPLGYRNPVSERSIAFVNGTPSPDDNVFLLSALESVMGSTNIDGTNLPVLNTETTVENYIKPIFLGSNGQPSEEFLYTNPTANLNLTKNADCVTTFMFANIQAKKSERGFKEQLQKTDPNIPNSVTNKTPSATSEQKYQLMFIEQGDEFNSRIRINSFDIIIDNLGKGINTILSSPLQLDNWYDGRWVDYNIGNNVTIGATNDPVKERKVGDRLNWSFGSVFLAKTFGSITRNTEETFRELKYTFDNGKITLSDWDFSVESSPTTFTSRYGEKISVVYGKKEESEILSKDQISKGVVGRKIFTFLMNSLEEGENIRIEEAHGGIKIGVDFNYNKITNWYSPSSSSSIDNTINLYPGNTLQYVFGDGVSSIRFTGRNDQISYIEIGGDTIPVSTVDGFLVWNYGTINTYTFKIFNECHEFRSTLGYTYQVCFVGYPRIIFTLDIISRSSSSTSSESYSSNSSVSSDSSVADTSSSSSYDRNHSSTSSSSLSLLSVLSLSSLSSKSSQSKSSDSSSSSNSSSSPSSNSSLSLSSDSSSSISSVSESSLSSISNNDTSSQSESSLSDLSSNSSSSSSSNSSSSSSESNSSNSSSSSSNSSSSNSSSSSSSSSNSSSSSSSKSSNSSSSSHSISSSSQSP
jgi:hypothetical protein